MASRLRRMLLVNTRTSGNETSATINEVDPRGGASITGENAVGKTTTLELFPLFFGTLPSQITETAGGREPMLKFVLPMAYSAIVFEYQRGDDETHDLRCAVLRRGDNEHRPIYRLINRGFVEDAFMRLDENGRQVFCDDAQMVNAYLGMGAEVTRQLDIAEYRAVILGAEARTQDAKALRRMSAEYGFGTRLTNLDRLISAVAKERLDFKDFVRLAITIVQERLTASGDAISRQKVTLRQSKDHISRWLRDRQALENAFELKQDVQALRDAIEAHAAAERRLRTVRQEVAPVLLGQKLRRADTQAALVEASKAQAEHSQQAQEKTDNLKRSLSEAQAAFTSAQHAVNAENARRDSLHLEEVAAWAAALDGVAEQKDTLARLKREVQIMQGRSSDIAGQYERLIADARQSAIQNAARIRASKDGEREQAEKDNESIREAHGKQAESLDALHNALEAELTPQIENARQELADLKARLSASQASPEARQAQEDAQAHVNQAGGQRQKATEDKAKAEAQHQTALHSHREAEQSLQRASKTVEDTRAAVQQAQSRLTPADGTLWSVLRNSPPEDWKSGLAKVIDPALLTRTDLQPEKLTQGEGESVLGWSLDLNAIASPDWTDDAQLRDALEQAQRTHEAAKAQWADAKESLRQAADAVTQSKKAAREAEGAYSVAGRHLETAQHALRDAQARCMAEVDSIKRTGQSKVQECHQRLQALQNQLAAATKQRDQDKAQVKQESERLIGQRKDQLARALQSIEDRASEVEQAVVRQIKTLEANRDAQLEEKGVDTVRLNQILSKADQLHGAITTTESRESKVHLWRQWQGEGGDLILAGLRDKARAAEAQQQRAQSTLDEFTKTARKESDRLDRRVTELNGQLQTHGEAVRSLEALLAEHGLSEHTTREPDLRQSAEDLKTELNRARFEEGDADDKVRRLHNPIRNGLTGRASSVADYVQQSLDALPAEISAVAKAHHLCTIYDSLNRQVLPSVINDVTVILNQVRQFRQSITQFESEVSRFNLDLQRGLNVGRFHRIENLKVAIVTNFGDLAIMREIDEIDKVAKAHATALAIHHETLPDVHTANALTKFLHLLHQDSTVELDLAAHVDLKGSVTVNGQTRHFSRPADLEHISSTGINAIILITLLVGMLNMIRGDNDIHIPWITDEVGKFDPANFKGLMDTLRENRIDPVTASPKLTHSEFRHFARRYRFEDKGSIMIYDPLAQTSKQPVSNNALSGARHEA